MDTFTNRLKYLQVVKKLLKNSLKLPAVYKSIINWPSFLMSFARLNKRSGCFLFRDGTSIYFDKPIVAATVMTTFFWKRYGVLSSKMRTIVDIGANIGVFTLFAAVAAPFSRIYSFEPDPKSYQYFLKNISKNHIADRVFPQNLAVSIDTSKRYLQTFEIPLYNSLINESKMNDSIEVGCTNLINIINENNLSNIDVLKLNCEGSEYDILYNTDRKYLQLINNIRMEYHNIDSKSMNVISLTTFLQNNGFFISRISPQSKTSGFLIAEKQGA